MNLAHLCPGSKWWKFDFHAHTPASSDYGKGPDSEKLKRLTQKEWLLSYMKAEIDCVAVCDHNTGNWIDPLKSALDELREERPEGFREIYLFPGVELSVNGNIHLLGIFPSDRKTEDINRLLGRVQFRGENGAGDSCTVLSMVQVVDAIAEAGGLAIPAHIDSCKGLFVESHGTTLSQILSSDKIIAMEMMNHLYQVPQDYINKKVKWTEVVGSDSHHPTGGAGDRYPGSHYTWIKMSEPNYDGLRLALLDGDISVRRFDTTDDPNNHSSIVIKEIDIDKARYFGRSKPFSFYFNPWLNSIIGGRGTGKSTIVELLRKTMGRTEELPSSLKSDFEKYFKSYKNRNEDGLLTEETRISVRIVKDDVEFRIVSDCASGGPYIEKLSPTGDWEKTTGDVTQRFPIRMYSQKQIFEMSKEPDAVLRIINESPDVDYYSWNKKNQELRSEYMLLAAQYRKALSTIQEKDSLLGMKQDLNTKIELIEKSGQTDLLRRYHLCQQKILEIQNWKTEVEHYLAHIGDIYQKVQVPEINETFFSNTESLDESFVSFIQDIQLRLRNSREELKRFISSLEKEITEMINSHNVVGYIKQVSDMEKECQKKIEELQYAGFSDPNTLQKLIAQRQDCEMKLKDISKNEQTLDYYKSALSKKGEEILHHRKDLTERRIHFLDLVLDANPYVRIGIVPFNNLNEAITSFRQIIHREQGGFEKDINSLDNPNSVFFRLSHAENICAEVRKIKNDILSVYNKKPETADMFSDRRFAGSIQGLTPEDIDRLMLWYPEDALRIEYKTPVAKGFMPVEQGSPGQKTAALLAFILSYGDEPLVLDQPEDDLDNQLIYDLIVSQIREIKTKRQIIVVTHNANIVVNGDSENVLVLEARNGETQIAAQGGLQEQSTRQQICKIMEGGKEAFEQRYKRIVSGL